MGNQISIGVWIIVVAFVSSCATPIGVARVDDRTVYREFTRNILSGDELSPYSLQFLQREALTRRFRTDPEGTLAELHSGLGKADERDRLFALSELSFSYAQQKRDQAYFLASAVYAYAFLFPDDSGQAPEAYDPRLPIAMNLYDLSIASGLMAKNESELDLSARNLPLPFGSLVLSVERSGFSYGGYSLTHFVSVSDLQIRGLRNRYHQAGIGAPVVAQVEATQQERGSRWISPRAKVPVTAFVRMNGASHGMSRAVIHATVELLDVDDVPVTRVNSHYLVPVASDPSTALAYALEGAPVWDFEIAGFRRGDFSIPGIPTAENNGLFMLHPYLSGRIPVVFVHGTASSPARWAEMGNELYGDARIRSHYQLWYFIYNTSNPVAYSAMRLREALEDVRKDVDPNGTDPGFKQMVIIGHSQGGLLAKMMVVHSGSRFWDARANVPFGQASLDPETRELLSRALFVEPLPYVNEVVFIATPHHGSFLASGILGKLAMKFINLPGGLVRFGTSLSQSNALDTSFRIPTAIDNMDWSNPFLRTLASLPIAKGVHAHSIIAVKGRGPIEEGDDGVVAYTSAHIDGVESELIVRSGHSTQGEPQTIEGVRCILYEHAGIH